MQIKADKKTTYQCSECDFITTKHTYLKTHKESKHAGKGYPCKQCDYAATTASCLKRHKQYKHEGLRYPCDQCEYSATQVISKNIKNPSMKV